MNLNEFTQKVEEWLSRIAVLEQRADGLPPEHQDLRNQAFEEISIAAEELHVAQEQLALQNEELAQQNEELAHQNEELAQKNEQLAKQKQELEIARRSTEAERQRYQELFEFAPDGYLVTDAEGIIQEANRAAAELLKLSQGLLTGSCFFNLIAAPDRCQVRSQLPLDSKIDWVRELEACLQLHASWRVDVALKVAAVRDRSGQLVAMRWQLRDITSRKRLEEELKRLYREAMEANRIKDEFLAIVSHELRTPLNAIVGWAQMLHNRKLNEATTAKAIEVIQRNASSQAKLIEDILDISRIVQGQIRLNTRPLYLVPIIDAAIENVRPTAELKAIQIESILDPSVGQVMGDAERLQQIVWNLLSNAIKFTPREGRVEVRLESVNASAQMTVKDTGKGISADFLPYVFERFRQADGTTTRKHGGLGLGLAIVRHLVEMHNGTVNVASDGEGMGATFTVQLPTLDLQEVPPLFESQITLGNLPALDGLRVLVVDDQVDTLELIAFILQQCKAQVMSATSASVALDAIANSQPDILISDIGMPEEDGYSLIRKVRTLEAESGGLIAAIALTAFARDEERTLAFEAGFQRHVPKPVDPAELVRVVAHLAGRIQQTN